MRITSIIQLMKGKEKIDDNETAALVWTVTLNVEKVNVDIITQFGEKMKKDNKETLNPIKVTSDYKTDLRLSTT